MGTKQTPGRFDCYAKLNPDEPYLTLRAKDPMAPYLVMMWVKSRQGDWLGCQQILMAAVAAVADADVRLRVSGEENPKLEEALNCALSMREWRKAYERTKVQADGVGHGGRPAGGDQGGAQDQGHT